MVKYIKMFRAGDAACDLCGIKFLLSEKYAEIANMHFNFGCKPHSFSLVHRKMLIKE